MNPILEVKDLKKHFSTDKGLFGSKGAVKAVDGVDFEVNEGETLSIVGESGCGKSTTGRCITRLIEPTSGSVIFQGKDITKLSNTELRLARRDIQFVFQDPFASLNPRKTIRRILMDPLIVHGIGNSKVRQKMVEDIIEVVGLNKRHLKLHPHEFSGGQRQRIGIARALILKPKLIILDEPVSALDVSVQAQILNLLRNLQKQFHLTYVFISHDLSVVRHISDRVVVMYLGKVVEVTSKNNLFKEPNHPYTKALLSSVPIPDPEVKSNRTILEGELPSPSHPPNGCVFHTRCPFVKDICIRKKPELDAISNGHLSACHLNQAENV